MKKKFKILGLTLSACMAFGLAALASGCSAKDKTDKWFEQLFCEHKYDEGVETQAPTCTEEGVLTYTCTECGKTKKKDIAMIEHTEVEIPSVSPTCTEVGYTDGVKCAVCEEVLQQPKVVSKIAHFEVLDSEAVAATCTTAGLKPGTHCARCNEVITAETVIPALGHLEVPDTAVEATCTTSGLTEGKHCKRCNEVLEAQEEIPATGHTEVTDAAVAATCTTDGKTAGKHCSVCNTVITAQETIPATGHKDDNVDNVCDSCNENLDSSELPGEVSVEVGELVAGNTYRVYLPQDDSIPNLLYLSNDTKAYFYINSARTENSYLWWSDGSCPLYYLEGLEVVKTDTYFEFNLKAGTYKILKNDGTDTGDTYVIDDTTTIKSFKNGYVYRVEF